MPGNTFESAFGQIEANIGDTLEEATTTPLHPEDEDDSIAATTGAPDDSGMIADEEEGIAHMTWGKQSYDCFKSACRHFNKFLVENWFPKHEDDAMRLFGRCDKQDWFFDKLPLDEIGSNMLNGFARYLFEAKQFRNTTRLLSYNGADRYFSVIKIGINRKLLALGKTNPRLNAAAMKQIRDGLVAAFTKRAMEQNEKLSKPHETATNDDLKAIAVLCIWANNAELAKFFLLMTMLHHLAGRATEVARTEFKNLSMNQPPEFANMVDSKIIRQELWRTKTKSYSLLEVLVHKSCFLLCYYFALGYSMILSEEIGPFSVGFIFPHLWEKIKKNTGNSEARKKKARDGISGYVNDVLKKLSETASALSDMENALDEEDSDGAPSTVAVVAPSSLNFNPAISSHSQKRLAVNTANENYLLNITWICFRAGWLMQAVHTIFDYLGFSPKNDRQVARALAGWEVREQTSPCGHPGVPPSFYFMKENPGLYERVSTLSSHLFAYYTSTPGASSQEFHNLLTATILMRLPDFIQLLLEHPEKKFGTTLDDAFSSHRFLKNLARHALHVGAAPLDLVAWGKEIEADFCRRNFPFMTMADLIRTQGEGQFIVDTRTMQGFFDGTGTALAQMNNSMTYFRQKYQESLGEQRALRETVNQLTASVVELTQMLKNQGLSIPPTATGVGVRAGANVVDVLTDPADLAGNFPTSIKNVKVYDIFQRWFIDELYNATPTSSCKQAKYLIKFCIEYLLLFLEEPIAPLPFGVVHTADIRAKQWRSDLATQTKTAWSNAVQFCESKIQALSPGSKTAQLTGNLDNFKKTMESIPCCEWPMGAGGSYPTLRSREELVMLAEQRQNKKEEMARRNQNSNKRSRCD